MKQLLIWLVGLTLYVPVWAGNGSSVHNIVIGPARFQELKKEVNKKKWIADLVDSPLKAKSLRGANSRYQLKGTNKKGDPSVVNIRIR